ncbi:hypothetical protein IIC_03570 [Bacillus cereus VD021]|uniref:Uncharacterized protein n=1 Tax=Bacillus cereus VD021 TaxID=1053224 RepID=R8HL85_BACCE|nr:hypothetical protein IIC_03570 [Bacillus cereus VD021]
MKELLSAGGKKSRQIIEMYCSKIMGNPKK